MHNCSHFLLRFILLAVLLYKVEKRKHNSFLLIIVNCINSWLPNLIISLFYGGEPPISVHQHQVIYSLSIFRLYSALYAFFLILTIFYSPSYAITAPWYFSSINCLISSDFKTSTNALIFSLSSFPSFTAITFTYVLAASESDFS